jgi:hypothetical protein
VSTLQKCLLVSWMERVILCLAVLYFGLHTVPRAWKTLNTDFPNYYLASRLVHEGFDTSRMYEWSWIEREKDHRNVDIRVIGLLPITPFSTLVILPLTGLAPLTAKHVWILANLFFLVPIAWMLRSLTGLSNQRIALLIFLSFPLHRNLLFGQFYVLLLLLLIAACWSYLRGLRILAGVLVALAAACKVFPLLLFLFFLRRRDWRALAAGTITGLIAIAISIAAFGLNAHRSWLQQILPWVLRGEGMPPYVPSASISGVLHVLFLDEPQWNPHPWHSSPLAYAVLLSALPMLLLAPAILLIERSDTTRVRILLEWSALLTASLATSTIPASYNFVLMIFPVCVVAVVLLHERRHVWLVALLIAYLGIGFPVPISDKTTGLTLLLHIPRLPLMMALLLGLYEIMSRVFAWKHFLRDRTRAMWATAMVVFVIFSTWSTLRVERSERLEYAYRLPLEGQGFLNASPQPTDEGVRYTAFTFSGYHMVTQEKHSLSPAEIRDVPYDDLSFRSGFGHMMVEHASSLGSKIVDLRSSSGNSIEDAREPMLSADGRSLAFIRDHHGRGSLLVQGVARLDPRREETLTPSELNVYEASFQSANEYAFSAVRTGGPPMIYMTNSERRNALVSFEEARYPALSPNGRWLAYSRLDHGVWNLWVRDLSSGVPRRIADVPCNQIQPSWESDSQTVLYGTDCGRSVWFTAIARRRVIP